MSKFQLLTEPGVKSYLFYCPGCECHHFARVEGPGPNWTVKGLEQDSPTVKPSIRVRGQYLCHSFVTDGKIQYLKDSTHKLAGQTVEIPDFEDEGFDV